MTKAVAPSPTVPFSKFSKAGATAFIATGKTADGKPAKYVLVPPAVTPATTQVCIKIFFYIKTGKILGFLKFILN